MQENIEQRVSAILSDQFSGGGDQAIDLAADLATTYDFDSLDLVELTMTVEDEFGIEIDDDTMFSFKTGQQIVDHVRAKV